MYNETKIEYFGNEIRIHFVCWLYWWKITNLSILSAFVARLQDTIEKLCAAMCDVTEWVKRITQRIDVYVLEWNKIIARVEIWWDCAPAYNGEHSTTTLVFDEKILRILCKFQTTLANDAFKSRWMDNWCQWNCENEKFTRFWLSFHLLISQSMTFHRKGQWDLRLLVRDRHARSCDVDHSTQGENVTDSMLFL